MPSLSEAYSYDHGELFQYDMLEYSVVGRGAETDACFISPVGDNQSPRYILDTITYGQRKRGISWAGCSFYRALILRSPTSVDIGGDSQRDPPLKVYNRVIVGD